MKLLPERSGVPTIFQQRRCGHCRPETTAQKKRHTFTEKRLSLAKVLIRLLEGNNLFDKLKSVFRAYRSTRINFRNIQRYFHCVHGRLQKHRELVGPGRLGEVRVHGFEADDLLKAVFQSEPIQCLNRVIPIRIRENLGYVEILISTI